MSPPAIPALWRQPILPHILRLLVLSIYATRFNTHYSGQPTLLHWRYKGTTKLQLVNKKQSIRQYGSISPGSPDWSLYNNIGMRYAPAGNIGTIAQTGATAVLHMLSLLVVPILYHAILRALYVAGNRHYSTSTVKGPTAVTRKRESNTVARLQYARQRLLSQNVL